MFTNMFVTRQRRVSHAGLLYAPTIDNVRPIRKVCSSSALAIPQVNGVQGMEEGGCEVTINVCGSSGSQSSDDNDMDDIVMFPLFDVDEDKESSSDDQQIEEEENEDNMEEEVAPPKPLMTLRQRRHSRLLGLEMPNLNLQVANKNIIKTSPRPVRRSIEIPNANTPRGRWLRAFHKIRSMDDPWEKFNITDLPVETAVRYRYNAMKKKWAEDRCSVRMEKEPFNHGAMRSCFRLKKLSSFSKTVNWRNAMNYVAKSYMEEVDRDVYFEDVRLQMDAKLWGEEYNRHNPPKKVDIFQMSIIEFVDRPGRPLYHLEHFIEGDYIKYNSNSGFVDQNLRNTPHAFSHFTFERSGHQMIIVDIQGVGDLWTDPQIHTVDGKGYGDGNLGTRGMALFFHSHTCNYICDGLTLSKFDLAPSELSYQETFRKKSQISPMTMLRGDEAMCLSASYQERHDLFGMLARCRSRSTSERSARSVSSSDSAIMESPLPYPDDELQFDEEEPMSPGSPVPSWGMVSLRRRQRYDSESEDSNASTMTRVHMEEQERQEFHSAVNQMHRPSCISHEINLRNLEKLQNIAEERAANDSILGQIHHDMALYHELGRFALDECDKDMKAALYHEEQAAKCGNVQAILTLARLYLGMQRDILVCFNVEECEENLDEGVDYMEMAAHAGDRSAMLYMANAYETGIGLGTQKTRSYQRAVDWYEKAIDKVSGEEGEDFDCTMDHPTYQLKAKMAELYLTDEYDLEKDASYSGELYSEAAEAAMVAMKGKLSAKYYMLAEEAWAQVEE